MSSKHTLMSLCQQYDKIEIPIIQRDYAQGRKNEISSMETCVRKMASRFTLSFLLMGSND